MGEVKSIWQDASSAPDDFGDTYFLVRPRGLHPARVKLDGRSARPIGSWVHHKLVTFADSVDAALYARGRASLNQGDGE